MRGITGSAPPAAPAPSRGLRSAAALASAGAALGNAIIFALAVERGIFPSLLARPHDGTALSLEPVIAFSLLGAATGVGMFGLIRERVLNPIGPFIALAAMILLLAFGASFAIPGITIAQATVLNLLHVVVATVVILLVWRVDEAARESRR